MTSTASAGAAGIPPWNHAAPLSVQSPQAASVMTGADAARYAATYGGGDSASHLVSTAALSARPVKRRRLFLGFCCSPARTFCCGCPLRDAVRWIGVGCIVWGIIGLINNLVVMDNVRTHTAILNIISTVLLLALGVCCWQAAASLSARLAEISIVILAVNLAIAVGGTAAALIVFQSAEFRKRLISEFVRKFEEQTHRKPSADDMAVGERAADSVVPALIAALGMRCVAEIGLAVVVVYVLWSFAARVKSGELLLVTHGVYVLPTVVVVVNQQQQQDAPLPSLPHEEIRSGLLASEVRETADPGTLEP